MCHSSTRPGTSYQFYQAFPRIIVLQAINAGVRRPGYKATNTQDWNFRWIYSMLGFSHEMKVINRDWLNKGLDGDYKMSVLRHIIESVDSICRDSADTQYELCTELF